MNWTAQEARYLARRKRPSRIPAILVLAVPLALFGTMIELPRAEAQMPVEEPEPVVATVTAYTSSEDETDENPFENASGGVPGEGSIACPSKYEFGTRVEIEGRTYVCDDRMNARYRDTERFDVWMPTKAEAKKWGKQELPVAIEI